jgi:uncharacterized protein (TIGR03067 family)
VILQLAGTIHKKEKLMRVTSLLAILIFTIGCGTPKNAVTKSDPLNGTWLPVKQEIGGGPLPRPAFQKQRLIIHDSAYTVIAESIDKGIVRYSHDKMDIYGKEGVNAGKHFKAIYKKQNNRLTICYNLSGDKYPESFGTKGKPRYFLCVFKKQ